MKTVVTSFNEEGYRQYGWRFIETFDLYWPSDVRLVVFHEGVSHQDDNTRAQWRPISEVKGLGAWMANIAGIPLMNGKLPDGKYNIQFDARMARKAFIECHAIETFGGKVFWVDADVLTFAHVPATFLDEVLPDDKFNCYLGRDPWFYTESGFIGFNADHPAAKQFVAAYRSVFQTGVIFTLQGWHDCYGFDATRKSFGDAEIFHDLASHLPQGVMHPFVNSVLAKYMDHLKGPRKKTGRSKQGDLVIAREEDYWNKDKERLADNGVKA